jgi:hypothetical protein
LEAPEGLGPHYGDIGSDYANSLRRTGSFSTLSTLPEYSSVSGFDLEAPDRVSSTQYGDRSSDNDTRSFVSTTSSSNTLPSYESFRYRYGAQSSNDDARSFVSTTSSLPRYEGFRNHSEDQRSFFDDTRSYVSATPSTALPNYSAIWNEPSDLPGKKNERSYKYHLKSGENNEPWLTHKVFNRAVGPTLKHPRFYTEDNIVGLIELDLKSLISIDSITISVRVPLSHVIYSNVDLSSAAPWNNDMRYPGGNDWFTYRCLHENSKHHLVPVRR